MGTDAVAPRLSARDLRETAYENFMLNGGAHGEKLLLHVQRLRSIHGDDWALAYVRRVFRLHHSDAHGGFATYFDLFEPSGDGAGGELLDELEERYWRERYRFVDRLTPRQQFRQNLMWGHELRITGRALDHLVDLAWPRCGFGRAHGGARNRRRRRVSSSPRRARAPSRLGDDPEPDVVLGARR